MAIKVSLGKLEMPMPFAPFITEQLQENNITLLNIEPQHTGLVAILPFHHRDPFDRLIIAQALNDDMSIIGKDKSFDLDKITRLW